MANISGIRMRKSPIISIAITVPVFQDFVKDQVIVLAMNEENVFFHV